MFIRISFMLLLAFTMLFSVVEATIQTPNHPPVTVRPSDPLPKDQLNKLPDLAISKVTFTPASPSTLDPVMISVEIANKGTVDAFLQNILLLKVSLPNGITETAQTSYPLAPGGSFVQYITLTRTPGRLSAGTYAVTVVLDPDNKLAEVSKTNNQGVYNLTITDGGLPDLVITEFKALPLPEAPNQFDIVITVKNIGTGKAVFEPGMNFVACPPVVTFPTINTSRTIAPGASEQITYRTPAQPPGAKTWTAKVDPNNNIKESDENNNSSQAIQVNVP
jgi:hypothetical protein